MIGFDGEQQTSAKVTFGSSEHSNMMQVKIQMPGGAQFSSTARSIRFSGEQEEASTQAIGHLSKMMN